MSETLTSPLTEADKDSLAELFARDPMSLTQSDVTKICVELRAQRAKWQLDDGKKASGVKPKIALSKKEMDDLLDGI